MRHPCAIGQPDAGAALSGGNYTLGGGFWSLFAAASRLMNENTSLFGNAQLQIELKPHTAVEAVVALQETSPAYKARGRKKNRRTQGSS